MTTPRITAAGFAAAHKPPLLLGFAATLAFLALSQPALAHGRIGNRVFPATLVVEDPAVADELTLPVITRFQESGEGWVTKTESEYSKRITSDFALSVGASHVNAEEADGWDNLEVGAKYQAFRSEEHEALISLGLVWDIGNSGSDHVGEPFSTITPTVFFGKGFGDTGGEFSLIRPLAVTGTVGFAIPTDRHADGETNPHILEWGLTLQYSLPYLQQHVKDVGLSQPISQIVPVIELAMETPLDGDDNGTTGTVNPGFIWRGQSMQVGAEAAFPVNDDSGDGVGFRVQMHFYLDEISPPSLERPLWN